MAKPKVQEIMKASEPNVKLIVSALTEIFEMQMSANPSFTKADALVAVVNFTAHVTQRVIEKGVIGKDEQYVLKRAVSDSIYLRLGV